MNKIGNCVYDNFNPLGVDISGWNGDHYIFGEIISSIKPKVIIEVGTWKGLSAINMVNELKRQELNAKIYCVDTWLGSEEFWTNLKDTKERDLKLINGYPSIYYQFISNVINNNAQDYIIPVPNTSKIGAEILRFMNVIADVIYIDASHDEESVLNDNRYFLPLLKKGGIMFGDDYGLPGVKKAVDAIYPEIKIIENNYWIYENKHFNTTL